MALSGDLRTRVVEAAIENGLSRNAAAERFGVSVASAVHWVKRFETTGEISPARTGGDRRSDRIEAHRDYLLGLIRRAPDMTLLEIQERLVANCGERFSSSVLWRFFIAATSHLKKVRACRGAAARGRFEAASGLVRPPARVRSFAARLHRRNRRFHQSFAQKRPLSARATPARRRSTWPLQDGHARRRPAPSRPRGAEGFRSADQRRFIRGLDRAMPRSHTLARRRRRYGQSLEPPHQKLRGSNHHSDFL